MGNKLRCFVFFYIFAILFISFSTEKQESKTSKKVFKLQADLGRYKEVRGSNVFYGEGNSFLEIDDNKIYCSQIEVYFYKDDKNEDQIQTAKFIKNVRIFNEKDEIQIGGESAEYYRKEKKFVILENAFYTDAKEEVAVFGDSIYNYEDENITIIQGNTRIYQKDILAYGAFVKYTKKDKMMSISGFPKVVNQGSEYSARKILVDVENNTFILQGDLEAEILNNEQK